MKQFLQNSTARLWGLSGLTCMVLMAGLLLEDGQARTYTPPQAMTPLQAQQLNQHIPSTAIAPSKELQLLKTGRSQQDKDSATQKQRTDSARAKKRMGLAMLFIGVLGGKS